MEKPDYIIGGLLRGGECHKSLGEGDLKDPSANGLLGCRTMGCPKNVEADVKV
jgi:hypothetical protein